MAGVVAVGGLVALLALPAGAGAAKIKVNELADDFTSLPGGECSLREAVESANGNADYGGCEREGSGARDVISLKGGKSYTRTLGGAPEDANASGDLDVAGPTTIAVRGTGRATIDAAAMGRVIDILEGGSLTAARLVLIGGIVGPGETSDAGGAVLTRGPFDLRSSRIQGNATAGGGCECGGGVGVLGGRATLIRSRIGGNFASNLGGGVAVINGGRLVVRESTIAGNHSVSSGGGIAASSAGSLKVTASTIFDNESSADEPLSGNAGGGGLAISNVEGKVRINNSTISANHTDGSGGGIRNYFSTDIQLNGVTITANIADDNSNGTGIPWGGGIAGDVAAARNSIISRNDDQSPTAPADDCTAELSPGHNLLGLGTGCGTSGSNVGDDGPALKPLARNGGSTRTHALAAGSPAIGRAGPAAFKRDQRGVKRDRRPDIGAYER